MIIWMISRNYIFLFAWKKIFPKNISTYLQRLLEILKNLKSSSKRDEHDAQDIRPKTIS